MDQATATIVAAIISATVAALTTIIIAKINTQSSKPNVYEFRLLHGVDHKPPWIRSDSSLARGARAICWALVFLLMMFGVNTVFVLGAVWFQALKADHPERLIVLSPLGLLALFLGYWIGKRIDMKDAHLDNVREDDDE